VKGQIPDRMDELVLWLYETFERASKAGLFDLCT
jgi:hypothetical protein